MGGGSLGTHLAHVLDLAQTGRDILAPGHPCLLVLPQVSQPDSGPLPYWADNAGSTLNAPGRCPLVHLLPGASLSDSF